MSIIFNYNISQCENWLFMDFVISAILGFILLSAQRMSFSGSSRFLCLVLIAADIEKPASQR